MNFYTEKYFFSKTNMECLGFWVNYKGVRPENNKVETIENVTTLNNEMGVHKLMGFMK